MCSEKSCDRIKTIFYTTLTLAFVAAVVVIGLYFAEIIQQTDKNEKDDGGPVPCKNNDTSSRCICDEGYTSKGTYCQDINECTSKRANCSVHSFCINTVGSYSCFCNEGFSGDGVDCTDIDECKIDSHDCDVNAQCINKEGSYGCTCKTGYTGDGKTCSDINECVLTPHICGDHSTCANTDGNYSCKCDAGYDNEQGGPYRCININECKEKTHGCDKNANCIDGYHLKGKTCTLNAGGTNEVAKLTLVLSLVVTLIELR